MRYIKKDFEQLHRKLAYVVVIASLNLHPGGFRHGQIYGIRNNY
jgi:hypothetical protein